MFIIFLHNDFDMHVSSGLFSPSDRKQNVCLPKSTQMMDTEQDYMSRWFLNHLRPSW